MTALPPITDFTDPATTEGDFKTALTNLRAFLAGLLGTSGDQPAALAAIGAIFGAGVLVRSSAYTALASDRGKLLACSGTWTLSLPPAATAGAGFSMAVANTGAGVITVDGDGAELIGGTATRTVGAGAMSVFVSLGSEWVVSGITLTDATDVDSSIVGASAKAVKVVSDALDAFEAAGPYVKTNHGVGVGTFCWANVKIGGGATFGATVAGSTVYPTWDAQSSSGTAQSGTWRVHGAIPAGSIVHCTLVQRIA